MRYVTLGTSDLTVSRIGLGGMSFGDPTLGWSRWALDDDAAAPVFRTAVELGITLWDTANYYGYGSSEEIVGRAIRRYTRREDVVLATKVFHAVRDGDPEGLSRASITANLEASLRRLGTDYIDLYQIHRFDPAVPVEETMAALDDAVRAGKVRQIGASSMWAWQFAKLQQTAAQSGWHRCISMQGQYSLVMREEEREMLGLLADQGVSALPWSPLAKGRLARPWRRSDARDTVRGETDLWAPAFVTPADEPIVDAVEAVAAERGVSMAQVAVAWVLRHPVVAAPIVGPTRPEHLAEAAAAVELELTDEEAGRLEEAYTPRLPTGF